MSLKDKIKSEINLYGSMTIDRYMNICLNDEKFGYYSSKLQSIGKNGDFITAPELSQVFGELIGIWFAQTWIDQGSQSPISLVELGPGNGTLMSDILRSLKTVPNILNNYSVFLLEKSKTLRNVQEDLLGKKGIRWIRSPDNLPDQPTFVIANEFFDSLPIQQFIKIEGSWKQRCVTLDNKNDFCFSHIPAKQALGLDLLYPNIPENIYLEINDQAINFMSSLSKKIAKNSGVALIIDYGYQNGLGDTLQAVLNHQFSDPLSSQGNSDLTSHVNFGSLAETAQKYGLRSSELCTQRNFLRALGIEVRSSKLEEKMSPKEKVLHRVAINKLVGKKQMGELFKAMAFTRKDSPPLFALE